MSESEKPATREETRGQTPSEARPPPKSITLELPVTPTTEWIEHATEQALIYQKTVRETVDAAITSTRSRLYEIFLTASAHSRLALESVRGAVSEVGVYEDMAVGKVKEGVNAAASHPLITGGIAAGLGAVLLKRPRFLYYNTLRLFASEEAMLSQADARVKELRHSINLLKAETSIIYIDECASRPNICGDPNVVRCDNRPGGYLCSSIISKEENNKSPMKAVFIGLGVGLGLLLLVIGIWMLLKVWRRQRRRKLKEKFFKRNGGLLLQEQLLSGEVNVEKVKMFTSKELDKATVRFNTNRMLGQGGQGTVYKVMLADGRIVAVKRSKVLDEGKTREFINEVVILSQINHRNVVKLLGCCLETEVPLLVYEFIPNSNLFQLLQDHENDKYISLTWEKRLEIAVEVSGALAYLHSAASMPIYHRDIKSTNILLDEKYRAKVADFGTSIAVEIDKTHVTTRVQGTFGYMDPEYFRSSQFTDKSDVYSFGVVLVELLTGLKAVSFEGEDQQVRSLVHLFLLSMDEDRLFDLIDKKMEVSEKTEEIILVANLARRCLSWTGKERPTMREVSLVLEGTQKSHKESDTPPTHEQQEEIVDNFWKLEFTSSYQL